MRTELRSNRWGVSGRSGRREDLRFLTGRGRYVADLALEHAAHLAVVRSPHACDSPSPLNPLGLKGTGEGSAVPGPAAIANAVADALGAGGPEITEVPIRARMLAHRS